MLQTTPKKGLLFHLPCSRSVSKHHCMWMKIQAFLSGLFQPERETYDFGVFLVWCFLVFLDFFLIRPLSRDQLSMAKILTQTVF